MEDRQIDRFVAIGGLGNDLKFPISLEQNAQTAAHQGMIVGNHYGHARGHRALEYNSANGLALHFRIC